MARKQLGPSLLKLEAAHYFELDLAQLNLFTIESGNVSGGSKSSNNAANLGYCSRENKPRLSSDQHRHFNQHYRDHNHHCQQDHHMQLGRHHHHHHNRHKGINMEKNGHVNPSNLARNASCSNLGELPKQKQSDRQSSIMNNKLPKQQQQQQQQQQRQQVYVVRDQNVKLNQIKLNGNRKELPVNESRQKCSKCSDRGGNISTPMSPARTKPPPMSPNGLCSPHRLQLASGAVNGSSTTSTNSLPSVSSSPSVSPSIVCPHLSLDDLLECRQSPSISPHTIGLCPKCRLDPPPNVHSPLSPLFRPCSYQDGRRPGDKMNHSTSDLGPSRTPLATRRQSGQKTLPHQKQQQQQMRRGYSDHQESCYSRSRQQSAAMNSSSLATAYRSSDDLNRFRDDSLDYCLGPDELKRLQMSPTLRNSVEFIRNNSIESGRVVKIYKNGEPFEKPLRVCITRGEFSNLDHFLDHISSRLLVPLGARYLFHLDGQLVYSVHELKHGSTYIVSGIRAFDYRANDQLKERQQQQKQQQQQKRKKLAQQPDKVKGSIQGQKAPIGGKSREDHYVTNTINENSTCHSRQRAASFSQSRPGPGPKIDTGRAPASFDDKLKSRPKASPQSAIVGRNGGGTQQHQAKPAGKTIDRRNSRFKVDHVDEAAMRSCDSLHDQGGSQAEKPVRLIRAKSELSALPKKQKKNVTFMDTGRGSSPTLGDHRVTINDDEADADALDTEYEFEHGANIDADIDLDSDKVAETLIERVPANDRRQNDSSATKIKRRTDDAAVQVSSSSAAGQPSSELKEPRTSDVGIQVSDSIEGFLIDLPVALPARGDDSNVPTRTRFNRNRPTRGTDGLRGKAGVTRAADPKRKQIVTITERQLSQGEMNELKDLSQGDHHHEAIMEEISISGSLSGADADETAMDAAEPEVIPDRTNTISIGSDPQNDIGTQTMTAPGAPEFGQIGASRLVTSSQLSYSGQARMGDERWQYPGGQAASATPTERPVSQSGPSESVRARVTTPTPSLSTGGGGDNNSLSMSYETLSSADGQPAAIKARATGAAATTKRAPAKLAPKRRVEVMGKLCSGLYAPTKNFRLVWVNGFAINDIYPDNSVSEQQLYESASLGRNESERLGSTSPHLSPDYTKRRPGTGEHHAPIAFKPSERYHNWVCHSRRHNELIYPVGSLIVLWCQWTDEQRYYSRHTSNVSSIALATLDLDLIASAQICDLLERPPIGASIHLWSLTTLDTLAIVEDDQMKTKLIFSLRVKNSKNNGCELSVGARDDKQMFLFTFSRILSQPSGDLEAKESGGQQARQQQLSDESSAAAKVTSKRRASKDQPIGGVVMRASKVLQANQVPLFIMKVPNCAIEYKPNSATSGGGGGGGGVQQQELSKFEPVIGFGRRCFQVWSPDARQQKLRLMQPDGKSAKLTNLIARATCLCRLAPGELLIGDSEGNVALLLVSLSAGSKAGGELSGGKRPPVTKSSLGPDVLGMQKYAIETIGLLGPEAAPSSDDGPAMLGATTTSKHSASITCLTRITGSLFMSADSTCTVRFWKIRRQSSDSGPSGTTKVPAVKLTSSGISASDKLHCDQLTSISLPPDLGFICTIILSNYNRVDSIVEFYIVSTCNTILFGVVKLCQPDGQADSIARANLQQDLLANSSLSVVYEGHETSASSLVADVALAPSARVTNEAPRDQFYFTCSLDCRICKWNGKQLVWKSMLPSPCASLAVHPVGFVMAVGSIDGTVYILDKISGLLISYFPLTPVRINCLAYSSDGSLLAAGCANGSIFILPVYKRGMKYRKVSIFQSPHAVVSLQFSLDNRYMLTSVTHGSYQELILWDLPNFRYMRDNVKLVADKIRWFDSICSGSEDVRAIWENANLADDLPLSVGQRATAGKLPATSTVGSTRRTELKRDGFVVNLSCHRLITVEPGPENDEPSERNFAIASDTRGYLRLFRYPCYDIQQAFYAIRISSSSVNCCRFLKSEPSDDQDSNNHNYFVSTSLDGSICLWSLE